MQRPIHFFSRCGLIAMIAAALSGCSLSAIGPQGPSPLPLKKGKPVRIMALGDSLAAGSPRGSYRRPLQAMLAQGGYVCQFVGSSTEQPQREGYSGFRIDQIASDNPIAVPGHAPYPGLKAVLARGKPDVILLMLGTNDVLQDYAPGRKSGDPGFAADAVLRLNSLLDDIYFKDRSVAIVVATIPPLRDPVLNKRAQACNALIPTVVATRRRHQDRLALADMAGVLTPADLAPDGIHLTPAGCEKMAAVWYAALTGGGTGKSALP